MRNAEWDTQKLRSEGGDDGLPQWRLGKYLEAGAGILSWQEGSFFAVSVHRPATLENRPLSQLSKAQGTEEVTRGKTSLASRSGGGWQCYLRQITKEEIT